MRITHALAAVAAALTVGAFVPAAHAGGFAPCGIEHPTACTCGYELVIDGKNTHLEPHQC